MRRLIFGILFSAGLSASAQITDTAALRTYINAHIVPNVSRSITAQQMNLILNGILNSWPQTSERSADSVLFNTTYRADTSRINIYGSLGTTIKLGGNSFGENVVVGTKDNNSINFMSNGSKAWTLDSVGVLYSVSVPSRAVIPGGYEIGVKNLFASSAILGFNITANGGFVGQGLTINGISSLAGAVGIGQTSPVAQLDVTKTGIGSAPTDAMGAVLRNTTAAGGLGLNQFAPPLRWVGSSWNQTDNIARSCSWRMYASTNNSSNSGVAASAFNIEFSDNGGTYNSAMVLGYSGTNNYALTVNGSVTANSVVSPSFNITSTFTPTGSSDPSGHTGDIAVDANYFYYKSASGWRRAALTTF